MAQKNIGRVQKIDGSRQLVMRLRCIKKIGFQSELQARSSIYINKEAFEVRLLKEKAAQQSEKEQSSKIDIISFPLPVANKESQSSIIPESFAYSITLLMTFA